jgi:hypothetical protein
MFPGVRYFMAREELKSLKETTVNTFFKVARYHGLTDMFRYYEHYSAIRFYNGSEISLLELKYTPSDPMFERLGSTEYTGGFIEECGQVHFNAFDTLRSRVGRHYNQQYNIPRKVLLTFNPKKNWLYHTFYKPWKENRIEPGYAFVQSLAATNTKIDEGYLKALDEIKDKTTKQRLKYGEWEYENDPNALIDFGTISNIFTNAFVQATGDRCITADIARFGADSITIRVWDGGRVIERVKRTKLSITQTADLIKQLANKYSIPMRKVVVDEDGVGGGVVDILGCTGFVANSRPVGGENFDNLKSQCGYKIAELINGNQIYEAVELAQRESITEELEQLKAKHDRDSDKARALMPKEQIKDLIGRSPDDLDTYIMRGYYEILKKGISFGPVSSFSKKS